MHNTAVIRTFLFFHIALLAQLIDGRSYARQADSLGYGQPADLAIFPRRIDGLHEMHLADGYMQVGSGLQHFFLQTAYGSIGANQQVIQFCFKLGDNGRLPPPGSLLSLPN